MQPVTGTSSPAVLAVVAGGGVIGSLGRAGAAAVLAGLPGAAAWATLLVNVVGALAIGLLASRLLAGAPAWWVRPFWITGVLGGFTTFSAYAMETGALLQAGAPVLAAAYLGGTVLAGIGAAALGTRLAAGTAA